MKDEDILLAHVKVLEVVSRKQLHYSANPAGGHKASQATSCVAVPRSASKNDTITEKEKSIINFAATYYSASLVGVRQFDIKFA